MPMGVMPVSQTLACRTALASAVGTKDFSFKLGDFGRCFIQAD